MFAKKRFQKLNVKEIFLQCNFSHFSPRCSMYVGWFLDSSEIVRYDSRSISSPALFSLALEKTILFLVAEDQVELPPLFSSLTFSCLSPKALGKGNATPHYRFMTQLRLHLPFHHWAVRTTNSLLHKGHGRPSAATSIYLRVCRVRTRTRLLPR